MGRSVSYATGSSIVCYEDVLWIEHDFEWEDYIQDVRHRAKELFPSLEDCDTWLGREDHAILENQFCYIGVSEYCGLASIWVVVKPDVWDYGIEGIAQTWIDRIENRFKNTFGKLVKIGTFSNGESIYKQKEVLK